MFPPHQFPAFGMERCSLQKERKIAGREVQMPQEACLCSGARQKDA